MTIYVDSSVYLKAYLDERDSDRAVEILLTDSQWVSGRHAYVEIRRNLARALDGAEAEEARLQFDEHWAATSVVEIDEDTCLVAADIAEVTGTRTLDALHLGAAQRVGGGAIAFTTFDLRLAQAARSLGWQVLGV